jgi:predicted RNA binding protein YcfA (HicA-like mRNA interferase family)
MSKHEKTLTKLCVQPTPTDIKWSDLKGALESLGYQELKGDGSRRKFIFPETKEVISLHKPHPQPEVKQYVIRQVVEQLRLHGRI